MHQKRWIVVLWFMLALINGFVYGQDESERRRLREILINNGFEEQLNAGVKVTIEEHGYVTISDKGDYFYQYLINGPDLSLQFEIEHDQQSLKDYQSIEAAVIVTHGWIDKAAESWPAEVTSELAKRLDRKKWVCIDFDWRGGSRVVNPTDAARYAREIAGKRLSKTIQQLFPEIKHVHMIGHSAGSWLVDTAARDLKADGLDSLHITFLDAYVPSSWKKYRLGYFENRKNTWIDHYYTKDFTLGSTERHLKDAFNAELTDIEPGVKEHRFPYRWYYATMTGNYGLEGREKGKVLYNEYEGLKYGFPRSREFSEQAWKQSLKIKPQSIKLAKPGKLEDLFKIFSDK